MEGRRLVSLPHVAGPFGVERVLALNAGIFRFLGLVSLVARIQQTLEDILGFRDCPGVDGSRLHDADRFSLNGAGTSDLVTTLRKNYVIEATARQQRARRRH